MSIIYGFSEVHNLKILYSCIRKCDQSKLLQFNWQINFFYIFIKVMVIVISQEKFKIKI